MEIKLAEGESFNIQGGNGISVNGAPVGEGGSTSIEPVAPSANASGKPADAKKVYEALQLKANSSDLATLDSQLKANSSELATLSTAVDTVNSALTTKQDVLKAGSNIDISEENVISVSGGSTSPMVEIEYGDLVNLRNKGELVAGMQYRITNYNATSTQENVVAVSNQFDIIVTADSHDKLSEAARAIRHEGDTYFPEATKFEAWQIWYSLDNDTARFKWAKAEGGTGVVYRMIDEFGNDAPYDFKNIRIRAYIGKEEDGTIKLSDEYRYTFGGSIDDSLATGTSHHNKIGPYYVEGALYVCENSFGFNCSCNTLGSNCYYNSFGNGFSNNVFKFGCTNNIFGLACAFNVLGEECSDVTFENDCLYNSIDMSCSRITFGTSCKYNTVGRYSSDSTFGSRCFYNNLSSYCSHINVNGNSSVNTFGTYCNNITLGGSCQEITFGLFCQSITMGPSCECITFGSSCYSISADFTMSNCEIKSGIREIVLEPTEENGLEDPDRLAIVEPADTIRVKV